MTVQIEAVGERSIAGKADGMYFVTVERPNMSLDTVHFGIGSAAVVAYENLISSLSRTVVDCNLPKVWLHPAKERGKSILIIR